MNEVQQKAKYWDNLKKIALTMEKKDMDPIFLKELHFIIALSETFE